MEKYKKFIKGHWPWSRCLQASHAIAKYPTFTVLFQNMLTLIRTLFGRVVIYFLQVPLIIIQAQAFVMSFSMLIKTIPIMVA